MTKQLALILIILLPAFSFGQNIDMAKGYYTKAREAYSQKNYQKALDYLETTKKELSSTNPDIIYMEVKSRFALRKVDDKIEDLVLDFLEQSDENDDRRSEVSMLLINYQELKVKLRMEEEVRLLKEKRERLKKEEEEQRRMDSLRVIEEKIKNAPNIIKKLETDMVLVEGGKFWMGDNDQPNQGKKMHKVILDSFSIGKYPITQAQWFAVMHSLPKELKENSCDDCPVTYVSWNDAQGFLIRLNEKTGKTYRLPTEAEWEFAAKGGKHSKGYKYSGSNILSEVEGESSHPVGQKKANELGIYDMISDVWEWCEDWYEGYYYNNSPKANPKGPSSSRWGTRVHRGGGKGNFRMTNRGMEKPDRRWNTLGFRVVLP